MSTSKRDAEARRWLMTARDDYRAAQAMLRSDMYAHAGFHSQQAAEKAVKALHFALDMDPWGHSVLRLLQELEPDHLPNLRSRAMILDKLYIPTRYPDALPGLTPSEAYSREEAEQALAAAWDILQAVEPYFLP